MFDFRIRESKEKISRQAENILQSPGFRFLLEEIPNTILIVNRNRQIIYLNKMFPGPDSKNSGEGLLGMRPGECLLCVHAFEGRYGCGSTEFCKVCGFATAITKSEKGEKASGECNLTLDHGETVTFKVMTYPFEFEGERFVFAYIQDISDFKTRQMLEHIFIHDITNSITTLTGLDELFDEISVREARSIVHDLSVRLSDEIHSYRLITEAESHMLSVMASHVEIDKLIKSVITSMLSIRSFRERKIRYKKSGLVIKTDETLLRRVLINTIKNALEAGNGDDEVTIFSGEGDKPGHISINVRSYPLIPRDVQLQLFQRAFSTKGHGRGWGTYSIRLLAEKYLRGKVNFISDPEHRTIFTISIPSLDAGNPDKIIRSHD